MTDHDFWASISRESPRFADWAAVFDDPSHVPITAAVAERVHLPIGERFVVFLRCDLLNAGEVRRLTEHLSRRFGVTVKDVVAEILCDPMHAVPILDEDVSLTILHPQKWLG